MAFTEFVVEDAALTWLESLGYAIKHGPEIAPGVFLTKRGQLLQKMQQFSRGKYVLANHFREGNSWTLSCWCD